MKNYIHIYPSCMVMVSIDVIYPVSWIQIIIWRHRRPNISNAVGSTCNQYLHYTNQYIRLEENAIQTEQKYERK